MSDRLLVEDQWPWVLSLLPDDLERTAREKLALRKRRQISSAEDLLRLVLAYSVCDLSLRQTAAWAAVSGLGELSDVAVLKRLRGAADWMGGVVLQCLRERHLAAPRTLLPVRLVDATVISAPGSSRSDYRLHLGLRLDTAEIVSFELTGEEGGESLKRLTVAPGEVVGGDRGYADRHGIAWILDQGGHCVIRVNGYHVPLTSRDGARLDIASALATLAVGEVADWDLHLTAGDKSYPMRLVTVRKSEPATAYERRRITQVARRKRGSRPQQAALAAAAYVTIITDLPREILPAKEALELYRLRWQIEVAFKRLKSLQRLDRLRAKDPALARCYLFGKLLGSILLDDLCERLPAFSPWGYSLRCGAREPLAITAPLA